MREREGGRADGGRFLEGGPFLQLPSLFAHLPSTHSSVRLDLADTAERGLLAAESFHSNTNTTVVVVLLVKLPVPWLEGNLCHCCLPHYATDRN